MKNQITPATDWPIGGKATLVDAYYRNPVAVRVTKHANVDHIIAEDVKGIIYFACTDRLTRLAGENVCPQEDDFSDVLG